MSENRTTPTAEWITLGTAGGPEIHSTQSQISNALVVDGAVYLFDLGYGVLRQLAAAGHSPRAIRGVFITHHHRDHNSDLGPVLLTHWLFSTHERRLPIIGAQGIRTLTEGLAAANEPTLAPERLTVQRAPRPPILETLDIIEVSGRQDEPVALYADENISVTAISVDHYHASPGADVSDDMPEAIALRVEAGGRVFVYTGDTGPSENLTRLARDADVFVTEVVDLVAIRESLLRRNPDTSEALLSEMMTRMASAHLTGQEIGRIAASAQVGEVVLTHYVPSFEDQTDIHNYGADIAPTYAGPVRYARDLDRFS